MKEREGTATFICGILFRRAVRNFLKDIEFEHKDVSWIEKKSFIESEFKIKGNESTLLAFKRSLEKAFQIQL
jgi:hypothetical protein